MKALTPTEQINALRRERTALLAKVTKLEADLAYLAMMVGVDLKQKEGATDEQTEQTDKAE